MRAEAIATVYRLSRALHPEVRILEYTATRTTLEILFDRSRPRGKVEGGELGFRESPNGDRAFHHH